MKKFYRFLPQWVKITGWAFINFFRHLPYTGEGRYCPVCGRNSKEFSPFGNPPRRDAQCMYCGALERHRFIWLYFQRFTNLFDHSSRRILHVAPELCFETKMQKLLKKNYITADLISPRAMITMDITDIQYPDGYFNVVYCSHVLEHVPDDRKALREFYRVLNPEGWAILLVPMSGEKTIEDPSITDPTERVRLFGQVDHVRMYGRDYIDRLLEAGFKVKIETVPELFSPEEIERMGLTTGCGDIYFCTKQ